MGLLIVLIVIAGVVALYRVLKKEKRNALKKEKAQLEAFLEQFKPTVFRSITFSREVSNGLKDYPSGAGPADAFLFQECLLIVEDENIYGFPALVLTVVARDWKNVPDAIAQKAALTSRGFSQSAQVTLESVDFKQSAHGVRIIQIIGYDTQHTHRKFSIALYHLTIEAFETLKAMLER